MSGSVASRLWEEHESTLCSLNWLGRTLYFQEKYVKAEEESRKRTLAEDHNETLASLNLFKLSPKLSSSEKISQAPTEVIQYKIMEKLQDN
ncbi:hypothetical protein N7451_006311 [Penicillium sp. IBT 35674x]|nr:hypothetical protein N7451_006311 [Penicillium sp. IBT 35674x]